MKLPHPATVMAGAALFLAAGGPAAALDSADAATKLISGKQIKNNSVDSRDIKDGSLTAKDFKNGVLTQAGAPSGPGSPSTPGGQPLGGLVGRQVAQTAFEARRRNLAAMASQPAGPRVSP